MRALSLNVSAPANEEAAQAGDVGAPGVSQQVEPVTRDVDRATIEAQTELQAAQREQALAELAKKASTYSQKLREEENQWVLPLAGYSLSAGFGETSYLWSTIHTGLDMAAAEGTPLVAVAQGTITEVSYDGAYGNKTVLTLEDGTEIWYCHQSSTAASVGDVVGPGDPIGAVGSTGNTTGPHLHIEVRPGGGDPIDPYEVFVEHGVNP